ncbi:MAG: acyl-CoA dehydrogenase, partial [Betaproteobacteria bacterium]|nr:acyl-CoA dehydrogenase [Betaproteobacteria bacterium]
IQEPAFDGEKVILPACTQDAHDAYVQSGMLSAAQDFEIGGMQLPYTVEAAANAFFACASVSIGGGMLTVGNANLLMKHGTDLQKQVFALNEFNGRFAGTMCLSEPQAGSSLSDVVTRATPDGDDHAQDPLGPRYRLKGNKMWISTGDHELTENIIHLVLAKIPGPDGQTIPGTKGISLFVVPKFLPVGEGESATVGARNAVKAARIEEKMGIHGNATCVMDFDGATGWMVGQPNRGLPAMFVMMNGARLGVGIQSLGLMEVAYQNAVVYAKDRVQGRSLTGIKAADKPADPILVHADIRRMLLTIRAWTESSRALALWGAQLLDTLISHPDAQAR